MKKKILTVALVVALLAIMVSGSLAYFTAQDQVTNTFTVGSVKIEIYENDTATNETVRNLGVLMPVVAADPSTDESYIDKVVDVKNTGASEAYIRTHIGMPTALVDFLRLDVALEDTDWTYIGATTATVEIDGVNVEYTVYTYDHTAAVPAGQFTDELLQGVYLRSDVDLEENADGDLEFILRDLQTGEKTATSTFVAHKLNQDGTYTSANINILVASEAIQTAGFSGATVALNSGFGTGTNPWN